MSTEKANWHQELQTDRVNELTSSLWRISKWIEECKNTDTLRQISAELLLLQRENIDMLWIPWKWHEEQNSSVLKMDVYWEHANLIRLLWIQENILKGNLSRFSSFSVGWSIGAGYLWYLLWKEKWNSPPEVVFGASAGSLFPVLYLLWKKALESNPEETKPEIEWLLWYLPQNLEAKTMFSNGEEIISTFQKTWQKLIDLVNWWNGAKLPNIEDITIGELSGSLGIIASRKKENDQFQEVLFSWRDKLLQAIIASSNPELKIGPLRIPVLTKTRNIFYQNNWYDWDHVNYNPIEYAERLGLSGIGFDRQQITTLPNLWKTSSEITRANTVQWKTWWSHDALNRARLNTEVYLFKIPKSASWLFDNGSSEDDYTALDQNSWWEIWTMVYRWKISYFKTLLLNFWKSEIRTQQEKDRFISAIKSSIDTSWLPEKERAALRRWVDIFYERKILSQELPEPEWREQTTEE